MNTVFESLQLTSKLPNKVQFYLELYLRMLHESNDSLRSLWREKQLVILQLPPLGNPGDSHASHIYTSWSYKYLTTRCSASLCLPPTLPLSLKAMLTLILNAIVLYIVSWGAWRFLRQYVVKTELDNIPGPPSKSFWKGKNIAPPMYIVCSIFTEKFPR